MSRYLITHSFVRFLSIIFLLIILFACAGDNTSHVDTPTVPSGSGKNINGSLTGRVILGGLRDGWSLDLSTGNYSRIPDLELWDDNPDYLCIARVTAYPVAYDGSEFIETVESCYYLGDDVFSSNCVKIYNQSGDVVKHVNYRGDFIAGAKLSKDSRYVAVAREYSSSNSYLEIHDRVGKLLSEDIIDDTYVRLSFSWLPDNSLVYSFKQSIYLTDELSTKGTAFISFTEIEGKPRDIAVSPDGVKVAFTLVTDQSLGNADGQIWIANIDGTNLRQLTTVPDDSIPSIRDPAWSPDGKWILAAGGGFNDSGASNPGLPDVLYAIPSNGEKVFLTTSGTTAAIPIRSYNGIIRGDKSPELSYKFQSSGNHAWLP